MVPLAVIRFSAPELNVPLAPLVPLQYWPVETCRTLTFTFATGPGESLAVPQKPAGLHPVHVAAWVPTLLFVKVVPELVYSVAVGAGDRHGGRGVVDGERVGVADETGVAGPVTLLCRHRVQAVRQCRRRDHRPAGARAGHREASARPSCRLLDRDVDRGVVAEQRCPAVPLIVGVVVVENELLAGVVTVTVGAVWSVRPMRARLVRRRARADRVERAHLVGARVVLAADVRERQCPSRYPSTLHAEKAPAPTL